MQKDKSTGHQEAVENLNPRFNEESDASIEASRSREMPPITPIIRSVRNEEDPGVPEPMIHLTGAQLRALIMEAMAQSPTPVRQEVGEPANIEKRKTPHPTQTEVGDGRRQEVEQQEEERRDALERTPSPPKGREERSAKKGRVETEGCWVRAMPFTTEVMVDDLPPSFRPITFEYNGVTDPWEHLSRFENTSFLHRLSDGVKCRVFPTTLTGPAQQWSGQLPERSVSSFGRLSAMFLHHFASSRKHKKGTITLFSIKQRVEEPLREYVKRFTAAMLEVPIASEEILISAMAQGLREGDLFRSLALEPVPSFDMLLERAEKYINLEEAQKIKKEENETARVDQKRGREEGKKQDPVTIRKDAPRERRIGPRFDQYSPLKAAPSQILATIERSPMLRWPATYSQVPRRAPSAGGFCRFHNDYGHVTDECQHLRDEIERIVRTRNLKEFVKTQGAGTQQASNRNLHSKEAAQNKPKGGTNPGRDLTQPGPSVNMIRGATSRSKGKGRRVYDSDLKRQREEAQLESWREELLELQERRYTPHITFGAVDETGTFPPSNRALIITAVVANKDVSRILIDTGSSVDIIYLDCLKCLNIDCEIQPVETDVVGFTGDVLTSIGQVILPVSLGDYPMVTTGSVKFLIMDQKNPSEPLPFNIIMGRPALNMFQAVVSTFHSKIKFPVNDLVGEVRGDGAGSHGSFSFRPHIHQVDLAGPLPEKKSRYDTIGRDEEQRPEVDPDVKDHQHVLPTEPLREVCVDPGYPEHTVRMGSRLGKDFAASLTEFLTRNRDVFAWKPSDLTGINPVVATHKLNVIPGAKPVKQKRRHFGTEKDQIIEREVKKLLEAGHIRRIQFPSWLSNAVLVKKAEDK